MMEEPCNVSLPGPAQPLSDLLEQLPVDVVQSNVWQRLLDSKASFRQTSLPCALLADLLCTSVTLHDSHQHEREYEPNQLKEEEVEPWHQAAQDRAAYLARLPRLTSLELQGWPGEAALVALLTEYGAATGGRLAKLVLRSGPTLSPPLTIASACAIRLACPALTELELDCRDPQAGTAGTPAVGDLLRPLRDVPLTSLILTGDWTIAPHSLRSLGGLSLLRHLDLDLPSLQPHHLPPLAGLINLRSLRLGQCSDVPLSFLDIQPLRSLSRLTRLELPSLDYSRSVPAGCAELSEERLAAGVTVLACLKQLEHLVFSQDFVVDDLVFSALRQLTKLTWLEVAHIHLEHPTPGHLPLLRHLHFSWRLQPSHLLNTLLPLLPLPVLESIYPEGDALELLATFDDDDDGGVRQAADLRTSCQHLAAAPHLTLRSIGLCCKGASPMPCLGLAKGLQPLAQHLTFLRIGDRAAFGAECGVLSASLPCVQRLCLGQCRLTDVALPALLSHWPSLMQVMVSGQGGALTGEGWLALAALRGEPLWVTVDPPLPGEQVLQCQAVQAHVFGRQNITFGYR